MRRAWSTTGRSNGRSGRLLLCHGNGIFEIQDQCIGAGRRGLEKVLRRFAGTNRKLRALAQDAAATAFTFMVLPFQEAHRRVARAGRHRT